MNEKLKRISSEMNVFVIRVSCKYHQVRCITLSKQKPHIIAKDNYHNWKKKSYQPLAPPFTFFY